MAIKVRDRLKEGAVMSDKLEERARELLDWLGGSSKANSLERIYQFATQVQAEARMEEHKNPCPDCYHAKKYRLKSECKILAALKQPSAEGAMSERGGKLRELIAKWRNDAIPHNKANTPVNEGYASGLVHSADELEALLVEPQPGPIVTVTQGAFPGCTADAIAQSGKWQTFEQPALPSLSADWPECEEFYNLMQAYRHEPVGHVVTVKQNYEAVKSWLRDRLHTRDKCT